MDSPAMEEEPEGEGAGESTIIHLEGVIFKVYVSNSDLGVSAVSGWLTDVPLLILVPSPRQYFVSRTLAN